MFAWFLMIFSLSLNPTQIILSVCARTHAPIKPRLARCVCERDRACVRIYYIYVILWTARYARMASVRVRSRNNYNLGKWHEWVERAIERGRPRLLTVFHKLRFSVDCAHVGHMLQRIHTHTHKPPFIYVFVCAYGGGLTLNINYRPATE